jgi:hypothetical protein
MMIDPSTNIVRARIGIGVSDDVTGKTEITVAGMTLYAYEQDNSAKVLGVKRFGAKALLPSGGEDADENMQTLLETLKFLPRIFEQFEDPLGIATVSNAKARELLAAHSLEGDNLFDVISRWGQAGAMKIREV